ncbi:penicillin-binding transpeptidase domain-containing protein [Acetanaerobacterium elongatum]|uniref:Penicillin-binding protein 2 n=1 Tax=Acetanaerobacterium elongatum TaxID=258515 RepID=A0A1H0CHU1_9FIRM|nr:penicillin-binding transpeptidase domain-containing protein [Acetanaerobacterium elongatum]SDN57430.1 penicillin-binding protein 2 [Acetanaerobacterium elongatum]
MKPSSTIARTLVLFLFALLIFIAYSLRLMQLQLVEGADYRDQANKHTERSVSVTAARGEIVDRNGRPLAVNRSCYNIVFDGAFMPKKLQNDIIIKLTDIFTAAGVEWNETLPLTKGAGPYDFTPDSDKAVAKLKSDLGLQTYATPQHVIDEMMSRYSISNDYTPEQQRIIMGVRYEMQRLEFSAVTPYTFATDVNMDIITKIKENSIALPGVDIQEGTVREYLSEDIAPHIIGQIGPIYAEEYADLKNKGYKLNDVVGKDGIEKAFEDQLRGKDGTNLMEFDNKGALLSTKQVEAPKPGNTVMLTMDSILQKVAQESLPRQIKHLNETAEEGKGKEANAGAVVAVDVKTGDVLAAATYPSYNINSFKKDYATLSKDGLFPLMNRAINGLYAAGSTFKPVVATAALAEGVITRSSHVTCNGVYTFFDDYQPRCLSAHGSINVITALEHSCNIFFYDTGRLTGIDTIDQYAALYGLGQKTGIEIPESIGQVASPDYCKKNNITWNAGDVLQASIGQSYTQVTPLQLAQYTATIARRGVRLESHIVKDILSYNLDQTVSETKPVVAATIEDKNNAFETVIDGMVACAKTGSASGSFGNYPIPVAAKTGTPESKQYPNSVFITFAPVDNPQIAIAVVIEKGWHGYTGAPVARDIYNAYFAEKQSTTALPKEETLLS